MRRLAGSGKPGAPTAVENLVRFVRANSSAFATVVLIIRSSTQLSDATLQSHVNSIRQLDPKKRRKLLDLVQGFYQHANQSGGGDLANMRGAFVELMCFSALPFDRKLRRTSRLQKYATVHVIDQDGKRVCDVAMSADVGWEDEKAESREILECKVNVRSWLSNAADSDPKIAYLRCVLGHLQRVGEVRVGLAGLDTKRDPRLPPDLACITYEDLKRSVSA